MKSLRVDHCEVPVLIKDEVKHTTNQAKANLLNHHFSSVFTHDGEAPLPYMGPSPYPSLPDIEINIAGVTKVLKEINPYKATGPDCIPAKVLKEMAEELSPSLALIFSASLQQGKIPQDWRKALITPLFKKGDQTNPTNYRPVSLTSICCKLLEHIIHSNVMSHLNAHNIISDNQYGFRKRRSAELQLIRTVHDFAYTLNELYGKHLKGVTEAKYLGVTIDCKLSFTKHIDTVCKKANSMLAFIRRNLKSCQRQIKADAYLMYVRPILEYATVVWAPHTKCDIDRLEAVQRRAARFVTSDYNRTSSVTVMLDNLNWSTLISRRQTSRLCLLYKIIHNQVDVTLPNYITPATRFTRGHDQKFILPQPRIDAYKFNFFPDSIRLWNSLPLETVHAHAIDSFIFFFFFFFFFFFHIRPNQMTK